ncbi:Hypothetical predicted protein, partial [Olea europaea subsp. europaea]
LKSYTLLVKISHLVLTSYTLLVKIELSAFGTATVVSGEVGCLISEGPSLLAGLPNAIK